MRRLLSVLVLIAVLGTSGVFAQTKKGGGGPPPGKPPTAKDPSIVVNVFMRDAAKNEVLVATRIFPNSPEYNSIALARFFAVMKALEPQYKQDDDVAYTWSTKGKVTKCSIYLESWDADVKSGGTGTVVGNWIAQRMRMRVTVLTGVKIVSFHPLSSGLGPTGGPVKKGAGSGFSVG